MSFQSAPNYETVHPNQGVYATRQVVPLDQLYGVELDLYTTRQALGWADHSLAALGPADIQPAKAYNPDLYTTQP